MWSEITIILPIPLLDALDGEGHLDAKLKANLLPLYFLLTRSCSELTQTHYPFTLSLVLSVLYMSCSIRVDLNPCNPSAASGFNGVNRSRSNRVDPNPFIVNKSAGWTGYTGWPWPDTPLNHVKRVRPVYDLDLFTPNPNPLKPCRICVGLTDRVGNCHTYNSALYRHKNASCTNS